jgi:ER-bound oxygenase mpaB/B'/Rubber oxygenase, catalytic domain
MTQAALDELRSIGDPPLDEAVGSYLSSRGPRAAASVFAALHAANGPADHPLLRAIPAVPSDELGEPRAIVRGQELFQRFSAETLFVLGSCSLPLTFAAGDGVQVLARTGRLEAEAASRLRNTARMIVEVMQPGGLAPGTVGWRNARSVRLLHALVRHELRSRGDRPWRPEWGTPINQEDSAGTLLTFSVAVLHALRRIGARISREDGDAYCVAWAAVGRLLGLRPELLTRTEDEGLALARRIAARQFRTTPEGRELTAAFLRASDSRRWLTRGYAAAWMRYFLCDPFLGFDAAELLGIPPPNWTRWLVAAGLVQRRFLLSVLDRAPLVSAGRSALGRYLVERVLSLPREERPGRVSLESRVLVQD